MGRLTSFTIESILGSSTPTSPPDYHSSLDKKVSRILTKQHSLPCDISCYQHNQLDCRYWIESTHVKPPIFFVNQGENISIGQQSQRRRRNRIKFNKDQIERMEKEFSQHKYLSQEERIVLSRDLGVEPKHVKTWYQNKRTNWKRSNGSTAVEWNFHSSLSPHHQDSFHQNDIDALIRDSRLKNTEQEKWAVKSGTLFAAKLTASSELQFLI